MASRDPNANPFLPEPSEVLTQRTMSLGSMKQKAIYFDPRAWRKRIKTTISGVFDAAFTSALPSDDIKDMPQRFKYGVGSVLLVLLVGVFAALFVSTFLSTMQTEFLSPISGTQASSNCETILIPNTGQYLASINGLWEGQQGFDYSLAAYNFDATNIAVSPSLYVDLMHSLYSELESLKPIMNNNDLANNLLYWTSFARLPTGNVSSSRFTATGDPLQIYRREYLSGAVSSAFGVCNASSLVAFDISTGVLKVQFSAAEWFANPICSQSANPYYLGYLPGTNSDSIDISVDVRSLMTAVAVNAHIIDLASLTEISAFRSTVDVHGSEFVVSRFLDPKFPGMLPIMCTTIEGSELCSVTLGSMIGIPYFLHKGSSANLPKVCNCTEMSPEEYAFRSQPCNMFQFLSGFLFWNSLDTDPSFDYMAEYDFNGKEANAAAFNAAFASSYWGHTSVNSSLLQSSSYINDSLTFCNVASAGKCSMLTISAFDGNSLVADWTVSSYYYQVLTGACSSSLVPTRANWDKLTAEPYAPLLQEYQKCTNSKSTTAFTALGISVGNLSAATPIVVAVFLTVLVLVQQFTGVHIPVLTYSKREKDAALLALAVTLLRERDRLDACEANADSKGADPSSNSVLRDLVRQLRQEGSLCEASGTERVVVSPMQGASVELVDVKKVADKGIFVLNATLSSSSTSRGDAQVDVGDVQVLRQTVRALRREFEALYAVKFEGDHAPSQSLYWSTVRETAVLSRCAWSRIEEDAEVLSDVVRLVKLHACMHMNCVESRVESQCGRAVGYQFADGVLSLNDICSSDSMA